MFSNRIKALLEDRGIKHSVIAKKCGVSPQTFSNWVNNKTQPDLKQSATIARIIGVSIDDLVERNEDL